MSEPVTVDSREKLEHLLSIAASARVYVEAREEGDPPPYKVEVAYRQLRRAVNEYKNKIGA